MYEQASERPPLEDHVTYEVTFPRDAEDQALALQCLVNAFGWRVREREALASDVNNSGVPERWHIKPEQLTSLSADVWGDEVYGRVAASLYGVTDKPTHNRRHRESVYEIHGETYYMPSMSPIAEEVGLSDATLESLVRKLWRDSAHTVEFERPPRDMMETWAARRTRLFVYPGPVTRDRLANDLRVHGLDQHQLHGTLGKAFDVLGLAAGVVSRDRIGAADTSHMEFIECDYFESRLAAASLSNYSKRLIKEEIRDTLSRQSCEGKPSLHDEIILEGWYGKDSHNPRRGTTYEKISVGSLHRLANTLYPNRTVRNRSARQFLKRIS